MNKVFSLNYEIPNHSGDFVSYDSNSLLSDADIILIRPQTHVNYYKYHAYWHEELLHVLELGKTVVVMLIKNDNNCYDFLPKLSLNIVSATGIEVFSKAKLIEPMQKAFKEYWSVQSYLKITDKFEELFSSKNNDRILGAITKFKNGHIIFIPFPNFHGKKLKNTDSTWNDLAISIGNSFKQQLSDIHNFLHQVEEVSYKPEWADNTEFEIMAAVKLLNKVEENLSIIKKLDIENERIFQIVKEKELLKNLLFETGKALEAAVTQSLKILGYSAENYDDGALELDQVILSPEGDRFIGECEGKDNKAIDITKFRQLQDSLNEDFGRDEVEEKAFGLLFGNPQRLTNPLERELDFTIKCKNGAVREKIGLINTVELFKVTRYLSENSNEEYKVICRTAIKEQLGQLIKFPNVPTHT